MKKTVIIYGLIAGFICGGVLAVSGIMNSGSLNLEYGMYFGFASMILAAVVIWAGMASYKKNKQGVRPGFGKLFGTGALMALIASTIYVFTWMSMYRTAFAGFGEKYAAYEIETLRKSGGSEAEIQKHALKIQENMKKYDNDAVYRTGVTYMEILPVQLFIVLIAAGILSFKKKKEVVA